MIVYYSVPEEKSCQFDPRGLRAISSTDRMLSLSDRRPPVRPADIDSYGSQGWQEDLRDAFRDPYELCEHLGLPQEVADSAAAEEFQLLAPRPFVARMRHGDASDPLLLQVLPRRDERLDAQLPIDAVGDLPAQRADGLIHKYSGRALLMVSGHCAVNCRYCFRRHFPYGSLPQGDAAWLPALDQIRRDTSLREVILSGGDPLVIGDDRFCRLVSQLSAIPHLQSLRIHTRLPVVIPKRITEQLIQTLTDSRLQAVIVLHINHANEIDDSVADAVGRLRSTTAIVLNQSVLLRGINDSVPALVELSEQIIKVGALPYYLHQLDMVPGVTHFEADRAVGQKLIAELRKRLPGYAVPRFVVEEAGEPHKTLLA